MPEMLPRWMPVWVASVLMILHVLTTLAGFVWLIVRALKTDKRFKHHLATCHPDEAAGKDTGD